ncbi:alpha/beta hydrolase [uncultured Corynebacterium sp.]|uniref:alpha/beta hydrolase n=1 Tax=uncultured Corynebacterium sp. TaxID=159447 RepID=UPI0025E8082D|nr:alpha/beta hydrolase [uncultured Corynebacterium sp.]
MKITEVASSAEGEITDRLSAAKDQWEAHVDPGGVLVGALLFAASLTPSLLPRDWMFQGVVAGISGGTGYILGVFLHWLWEAFLQKYVGEPVWKARRKARGMLEVLQHRAGISDSGMRTLRNGLEVGFVVLVILALLVWVSFAVRWQQELAHLMGAEAYTAGEFLLVLPIGIGLWALIVLVGKGLIWLVEALEDGPVGRRLGGVTRPLFAWLAVGMALLFVVDTVVPGTVVRATERVFSVRDQEIRPDLKQPHVPERSGSPESPNKWEDLGAFGTRFVGLGLYKEELEALTGRPSKEPIRVYAGLKNGNASADVDPDTARARSVVDELKRTGAKDRKALLVVPATGTGWVNPTAAQAFELMFDGDSAIASDQYSYLPSGVQFIADQQRVEDAGEALVSAVVDWWDTLPEEHRPKLYVYGESLGTNAGSGAFSGVRDIAASVDGLLWVGPPNSNKLWHGLVDRRDPGSPQVSAEYAGGLNVRFAENTDEIWRWRDEQDLNSPGGWHSPRILFLQHPSDPVVWWSPSLIAKEPDWLKEPAGFDRSPSMSWIPFVTFWQVTMDLPVAANVPNGHGHNYGNGVLDAMLAMVGGEDFNPDRAATLRAQLDKAMSTQGPEKEVGVDNG